MPTRKTDEDIRHEAIAHQINSGLIGIPFQVMSSKNRGPFVLAIEQLKEDEVNKLISIIQKILIHDTDLDATEPPPPPIRRGSVILRYAEDADRPGVERFDELVSEGAVDVHLEMLRDSLLWCEVGPLRLAIAAKRGKLEITVHEHF